MPPFSFSTIILEFGFSESAAEEGGVTFPKVKGLFTQGGRFGEPLQGPPKHQDT